MWRHMKRCNVRLHYDRKFQIFLFLIGHINVNKDVFCLIISYLQIKSYNVLNYNNCSTDWSFPLSLCFVDRCLSFCSFSFGHCVVCSSSIYRLWLPLWYLQTLLVNILEFKQILWSFFTSIYLSEYILYSVWFVCRCT